MNSVDAGAHYSLVPTGQVGWQHEAQSLRAQQAAQEARYDELAEGALVHQITLYVLAAALVVALVVSWLGRREAIRLRELLAEQAKRLDAQDQRITQAVQEMAAERGEIAAERQRLHETVDEVRDVGMALRSDFARAAELHVAAMASAGRDVQALIVQLQIAARGGGNVTA